MTLLSQLRTFDEYVREQIADPEFAAEYLAASAEEEDDRVFLHALKDIIHVYGGLSELARRANLNRGSLHRALSGKSRVSFDVLRKTLAAAGFQITFKPIAAASKRKPSPTTTRARKPKSPANGARAGKIKRNAKATNARPSTSAAPPRQAREAARR